MKTRTANDGKCGFGRLIDLARAEPMAVAKQERSVLVVMPLEEFKRLKVTGRDFDGPSHTKKAKE